MPVLDVDMQQPHYYKATNNLLGQSQATGNATMPSSASALKYVTDEGRSLSQEEKAYVKRLEDLKTSYPDVHMARSLDEAFHELLEPENILIRNGDQTLSRHIARSRAKMESDRVSNENLQMPTQQHNGPEQAGAPLSVKRSLNGHEQGKVINIHSTTPIQEKFAAGTQDRNLNQGQSTGANVQNAYRFNSTAPAFSSASLARPGGQPYPTPSQLESQNHTICLDEDNSGHHHTLGHPSSLLQRPQRKDSTHSTSSTGSRGKGQEQSTTRMTESSRDSTEFVQEKSSHSEQGQQDCDVRQQIIVVPQLWIWNVGGKKNPSDMIRNEIPTQLLHTCRFDTKEQTLSLPVSPSDGIAATLQHYIPKSGPKLTKPDCSTPKGPRN